MQPGKSPVRERKKHATRQALRQATLDLGLQHGLDKVHVDDIAARAGVSPRTFFNYFETKEDAAVIDAPEFTSEELDELARGDSGRPVLVDLEILFGRSLQSASEPGQEIEKYVRLHQQNPELVSRQLIRFARFEAVLASALRARLPEVTPTQAEVLAGACMVASRTALQHWSSGESDQDINGHLHEAFTVLRPAFQQHERGAGGDQAGR